MKSITFDSLPGLPLLYLKAGLKRNAKLLGSLPSLVLEVTGFRIDSKQLRKYLNAFEFQNTEVLPAPFLYLATQSIQLYMLTLAEFPISPAGLVHLGVACVKIASTYLARAVTAHNQESLPKLVDFKEGLFSDGVAFRSKISLCRHAGKRYARLSGDFNPIYLYRWSAKLFGFNNPIVHGLYLISSAYSELYKRQGALPFKGAFQFKSPFYLPGKANLNVKENNGEWTILVNSSDKYHLHGRVLFN